MFNFIEVFIVVFSAHNDLYDLSVCRFIIIFGIHIQNFHFTDIFTLGLWYLLFQNCYVKPVNCDDQFKCKNNYFFHMYMYIIFSCDNIYVRVHIKNVW